MVVFLQNLTLYIKDAGFIFLPMRKKFLSIIILIIVFIFSFGLTDFASAQYGLDETRTAAGLFTYDGEGGIPGLIGKIIGVALSFVGVAFLILMIYGGFVWMTARGKEQEITKAKETIISAVYGIVIVMGAYAVTYFIFNNLLAE